MSAIVAEFLGTMLLVVFGGGVVAGVVLKGTKSEAGGWIVITLAWGLGVSMAVYVVGDISGGHLNPAVTIGLATIGAFPWTDVLGYVAAQFAGAFVGATLVFFHYFPHWKHTEDKGAKLAAFSTAPALRHTPQNFFSEAFGTFILVFGILSIGANELASGLNPILVGLLIVVIGLSLGGTTGYAINPARDLAPRIAHAVLPIFGKGSSNWGYAWIPVVGPIIGGALGALVYKALFDGVIFGALYVFVALFIGIIMLSIYLMRSQKEVGLETIESGPSLKKSVR